MCRLDESNRKQLIHSLTHLCTSVFNSLEPSTSFTSMIDQSFTSQDLGRFHSDSSEIRLQHTWPQMTAHAQVMLLAISLLCP